MRPGAAGSIARTRTPGCSLSPKSRVVTSKLGSTERIRCLPFSFRDVTSTFTGDSRTLLTTSPRASRSSISPSAR